MICNLSSSEHVKLNGKSTGDSGKNMPPNKRHESTTYFPQSQILGNQISGGTRVVKASKEHLSPWSLMLGGRGAQARVSGLKLKAVV